jgi:transport inhibitor response 1
LNREIDLDQLRQLLLRAPQLEELGTGIYNQNLSWARLSELQGSLVRCKNLRSLSGLWNVVPLCIPSMYPVCLELTSLDLSNVLLSTQDFSKLITYCPKLQRLLVQDYVGDKGLQAAATVCKDLRELRVFPITDDGLVTEEGFLAISESCHELRKILYFCKQMTNAAMSTFARNCPKMTHFRLCIIPAYEVDCDTREPLDEGFGAVCRLCKDLRRLSLSGLLTDKTFDYIGRYAENLEMLSVGFVGDSDLGMQCVLEGCPKLRKLEVRDCPFGDEALLMGIHKYESMRGLWMSSCKVTRDGCQFLAQKNPFLNVEIITDVERPIVYPSDEPEPVGKLYVYRTLAGHRSDAPAFVDTLK